MGFFAQSSKISTDENAIEEVLTRGVEEVIVEQDLREKLRFGKKLRIKLGIDPTSPDLHIGRSIPLLKLRDFQKLGHQVVFIVGDFTATIGDTSDKESERPMLDPEVIKQNEKTYYEQVGKIIDLDAAEFRHNSEWLKPLTYKEIGEHANLFSVADFISRDNVRRRLEDGKRVSLRELLYPLMQGYDSVAIESDVEIGGMDQKFNVLAGRPLQEHFGQIPQNVILNPLIEGLDGRKMSSSWGNTISLTAEPFDMYGKVMSMDDVQVLGYFRLCTRVPLSEIEKMKVALDEKTLHPKDAKMRLARALVEMYHGAQAAQAAEEKFTLVFSQKGMPEDALEIATEIGTPLHEALVNLIPSKSELRRLTSAGAIVDMETDKPIEDINYLIEKPTALRIGKQRFVRLIIK